MEDISDLYIKWDRLQGFDATRIENVSLLDTIVSKIEMILLTNKGECIDPDFGADIPKYLWRTKFPASTIKQNIEDQIQKHVPELTSGDYKINVYILPGKIQDIGVVNVDLGIKRIGVLFA